MKSYIFRMLSARQQLFWVSSGPDPIQKYAVQHSSSSPILLQPLLNWTKFILNRTVLNGYTNTATTNDGIDATTMLHILTKYSLFTVFIKQITYIWVLASDVTSSHLAVRRLVLLSTPPRPLGSSTRLESFRCHSRVPSGSRGCESFHRSEVETFDSIAHKKHSNHEKSLLRIWVMTEKS